MRAKLCYIIIVLMCGTAALAEKLQPRPGWSCPEGNDFEHCAHKCKYVQSTRDAEGACSIQVIEHSPKVQKIQSAIAAAYASCDPDIVSTKEGNTLSDTNACNISVGVVLRDAYGLKNVGASGFGFGSASAIHKWLKNPKHGWAQVDGIDAQIRANGGDAVLASSPGHVAVVVPGAGTVSARWKTFAPLVVSTFKDDATTPIKCIPACFANYAFGKQPDYFVKSGGGAAK